MITAQVYNSEAEMKAAYKARQEKYAKAARRVIQSPPPPPRPKGVIGRLRPVPSWSVQPTMFEEHVKAFYRVQAEELADRGNSLRAYIRQRCKELGVDMVKVTSSSRKTNVVEARQLIMWEIKTHLKPHASYPEIGRLFDGRDHTTVLHAVRKIAERKARGE